MAAWTALVSGAIGLVLVCCGCGSDASDLAAGSADVTPVDDAPKSEVPPFACSETSGSMSEHPPGFKGFPTAEAAADSWSAEIVSAWTFPIGEPEGWRTVTVDEDLVVRAYVHEGRTYVTAEVRPSTAGGGWAVNLTQMCAERLDEAGISRGELPTG